MNLDIDKLIHTAVFGSEESRTEARSSIRKIASERSIRLSSINNLYRGFGSNQIVGFTVPAINIRTLTYDTARVIFRLLKKYNSSSLIFEIARSEMEYTDQRPDEYAVSILAAAIKEDYIGPVFLQGDHFQFKKEIFDDDPEKELNRIKKLTAETINAGFYNIDIDASTLVELDKKSLDDQQRNNYTVTAELTEFIRSTQPNDITVSIGGEIGHIGGVNSTVDDFLAFMKGYNNKITENGISKVSVQTGSTHGGVPLADGSVADVKIDFSVLSDIGEVAREEFGMGGAVQHGASTLPNELFGKFPEHRTLEIHLATGFQNIIYDNIPESLRSEIYSFIKKEYSKEKSEDQSEEQFIYKTRKKALGPFKKKLWELSQKDKIPVGEALEKQLSFLFEKLNIKDTEAVVKKYIYPNG